MVVHLSRCRDRKKRISFSHRVTAAVPIKKRIHKHLIGLMFLKYMENKFQENFLPQNKNLETHFIILKLCRILNIKKEVTYIIKKRQ